MWDKIKGWKTYIVCGFGIFYALAGWASGHLTASEAFQILDASLIGAGLRHGMNNS